MEKLLFDLFFEIVNGAAQEQMPAEFSAMKVGFYTDIPGKYSNVGEKNYPILQVDDFNAFMNALRKFSMYVLTSNHRWFETGGEKSLKFLRGNLSYLLMNMSYQDMKQPTEFVNRYIDFLNERTIPEETSFYLEAIDANVIVQKKEQPYGQETPYALEISLEKEVDGEKVVYDLPLLRYGISNDTVYLYAIQNSNRNRHQKEADIKFSKKVNRMFYKLNHGVEDRLKDVSPSFVFAESILMKMMGTLGLEKLMVVKEAPLKIKIKENVVGIPEQYSGYSKHQLELFGIITDVDRIRENLTTKFLHVSERMEAQIHGVRQTQNEESYIHYHVDRMLSSSHPLLESICSANLENTKRNQI